MKGLGFMGGDVDLCLMVKQSDIGLVYNGIYVDDCLLVGDMVAIEWTVDALNKEFITKWSEGLDDYLSCEVQFNKDKMRAWIGQPHMIKKIERKFGELVKKLTNYVTPGTP